MDKKIKIIISVVVPFCLNLGLIPAFASDNSAQLKLGMKVFMKKDAKKNSCNTCHPKGGTDGSIIDGKKVPNLKKTVGKMSPEKINKEVRNQAKNRSQLKFTEDELASLVKFVENLGRKKK